MAFFKRFFGLFHVEATVPNITRENAYTQANYSSWSSWLSLEEGVDLSVFRKRKSRFIGGAVDTADLDDAVDPTDLDVPDHETATPLKRALRWIKNILLFLVWSVAAGCLLFSPEFNSVKCLLSVPAGQEGGKLEVPSSFSSKNIFAANFYGPFPFADDIGAKEKDAPQLTISFELITDPGSENEKRKTLDSESITMLPSSEWDDYQVAMKDTYFVVPNLEKNEIVVLHVATSVDKTVTFKVEYVKERLDESLSIFIGVFILIGLYILIIWEIVNRTFAAILASTVSLGALSVLQGRPPLDDIINWIDIETMLLLFGLMVLVAILSESGIFDYMAVFAYRLSHGKIWPLINCLCLFVSVMSAFLDNVTMMLLITPVVIRLCEVTAFNPIPILLCMVIFSNIGACTTPVGDPPNVIISMNPTVIEGGINFTNFTLHMLPGVTLSMIQSYIHLRILYRRDSSFEYSTDAEIEEIKHEIGVWEKAAAGITTFSKDEDAVKESLLKKVRRLKLLLKEKTEKAPQAPLPYEETLAQLARDYPIRNHILLWKSMLAFAFVIACFFLHSLPYFHYMSLGWSALMGAIMLIILADIEDMENVLMRVEWSTMIFFASLFILMEVLTSMGVVNVVGQYTINCILEVEPDNRLLMAIMIIIWISGIAAALLSNIPVATMMIKIIVSLSANKELELPLSPLVWALAFGVCLGGNGTLIAATANIVSAGVAEQYGYKITFMQFFRLGFPIMLGELLVVSAYLYVAHILLEWH